MKTRNPEFTSQGRMPRAEEGFSATGAHTRLLVLALLCVFVFAASLSEAAGTVADSHLPQACPDGWSREGGVARYTKETLYEYINGEAELFFPFGFDDLTTAAYVSRSDRSVALVVDIYRMGSVLNAFGVYSNYRNPGDTSVKIGAEGSANPAQLLFFQDRYFVRLSASGTAELDMKTLAACAGLISSRLPGPPAMPDELGMLPSSSVLPGTVKYSATSLFGYPFFKAGLTADVSIDGRTAKAFVVIEDSFEAARKALDRYDAHLRQSGRPPGLTHVEGGEVLSASDPLYSLVVVLQRGPHLFGLARLSDLSAGVRFITDWAAQLRTP